MLSVIIPAYNEEKRIGKTLERIISYLDSKKYSYEIIVVDDGSRDRTRDVVRGVRNVKINKKRKNMGKGYSVKEGMLIAKGDYLLFSDADLSTPIEELEKLMNYIKKYDVIIGSRALKESDIQIRQPFYREYMGKIFNFFVQILTVKGIRDTQCGFKLFTKKAAKEIFSKQKIDGFGFDVEVLFIARKKGFKIKEVPIVWRNSINTKVSPVKDSVRMFYDILKVRLNSMKGKYR
ncbi:MAG: glycosyltransferase family 2 protein [Nanoarchaeota archaeon]|nr:glycosyltransferase family 2 protein [Nanoarchaeota archaeon]